jgi:hypothetical protein
MKGLLLQWQEGKMTNFPKVRKTKKGISIQVVHGTPEAEVLIILLLRKRRLMLGLSRSPLILTILIGG